MEHAEATKFNKSTKGLWGGGRRGVEPVTVLTARGLGGIIVNQQQRELEMRWKRGSGSSSSPVNRAGEEPSGNMGEAVLEGAPETPPDTKGDNVKTVPVTTELTEVPRATRLPPPPRGYWGDRGRIINKKLGG